MPIHIELNLEQELLLTIEGSYSLEDIETSIVEGLGLGDCNRLILDFSEARQDRTTIELERLTQLISRHVPGVVLVVADILYYGFARSMQAFGNSYGLRVEIDYRQP